MRHRRLLLAAPVLLAGCASEPPAGATSFGEAVRNNMALHIIDPEPVDMGLPPSDGSRRALVMGRYRTDTGEPPEDTTTTSN